MGVYGDKQASMLLRKFDKAVIGGVEVPYSDWVISTSEPDDDGDIMDYSGADLTSWERANCPVLFCHDEKFPVGSSKPIPHSDQPPEIRVEGTEMIARCYHHAETPGAMDVYANVERGLINNASITFKPIKARRPTADEAAKGGKRVFTAWKMKEWSIVPNGANDQTRRIFSGEPYVQMSAFGRNQLIKKGYAMADEKEVMENVKPSARMAQDVIDGLAMIAGSINDGIGSLEHDANAKALRKAMGSMCKAAMEMHERVSKEYPETLKMPDGFEEMAKGFMEEDGEEEAEEEGMEEAESDPGDAGGEVAEEEEADTEKADDAEAEEDEDDEKEKKIDALTMVCKGILTRIEALEEFDERVRKSINVRK